MNLRDYQINMLNGAIEALNNNMNPFVVSPTGSGKMIVIASLAKHLQSKVLIVEHRIELIKQAVEKLELINEKAGLIVSGVRDPNPNASIKVGMIQTIHRRELEDWEPDIIIIDEAHLAAAASYKKLLGKLADSPRVCFSATPWRLDGKGFRDVCDTIVLGPTIKQLVRRGYLVPTEYLAYDVVDFTECKIVGNEYDQEQVATMMEDITGEIVETWFAVYRNRSTIVFAANTTHSKKLCEAFRAKGVKAEHIDGTTPDAVRAAIINRVKSGETQVLCNCGIVIEGFDAPIVSCVVLAIATKSLSKFLQCCGRGMRLHPESGKTDLVVMDFGGCYKNHGVPEDDRTWTLEDRNVRGGKKEFIEDFQTSAVEKAQVQALVYQQGYDYGKDERYQEEVWKRNYATTAAAARRARPALAGEMPPPLWLPASWRDYWRSLEEYRISLGLPKDYSERMAKIEIIKRRSGY